MKPKTGSTGNLLLNPKPKAPRLTLLSLFIDPATPANPCPESNRNSKEQDRLTGLILILFYIFLILVLSLSQVICAFAQPSFRELKIGDSIPPPLWNQPLNVVNHPEGKTTITLGDYRGKLIILDFWATWCSSCIAAMPELHKLSTGYRDNMVTIPVTTDPPEKAAPFLRSNLTVKDLHLSSIAGDTLLSKIFPYRSIPHYIWISPEGKVLAATEAHQLTKANIQNVLKRNSQLHLVQKDAVDLSKPLFFAGDLRESLLKQFSVFMYGFNPALSSRALMRTKGDTIYGRCCTNVPLLSMYRFVAQRLFRNNHDQFSAEKRFVVHVAAPELLNTPCSYDYVLPPENASSLFSGLLDLLNSATSYYGRVERNKVPCMILVRTGPIDGIASKGGTPDYTLVATGKGKLRNTPLKSVVSALNNSKSIKMPVLDGTNSTQPVDLSLDLNTGPDTIRQQLQALNLDLRQEEREISLFILSDKTSAPGR